MEATGEQVYYLWACGKCGKANSEAVIFCPYCAAQEGLPNAQAAPEDKTGKLTETLGKAIEWSLQNGQVKPAEVLAQAAKRGRRVATITDLRSIPLGELDRLADSFLSTNRAGATGSGLVAGLPGGLAAFATIPADITANVYFALRCLNGVAQSYGFEVSGETYQTVELLAFAFACRMETVVIGQRRLETFDLARFLLQSPDNYSQLVRACTLKQLSAYLTVDFAKTSWATFLPVVGGVVNGMDNFWFLGEVSKRGKHFYRNLLATLAPVRLPSPPVPKVVTIEVSLEQLNLPGQSLDIYLAGPEKREGITPGTVLVLWPGAGGREIAERLAEKDFRAILPLSELNGPTLTDALNYLIEQRADLVAGALAIIASGAAATTVLETLASGEARPEAVILFNPLGPSREISVSLPLLLHWGEVAAEVDPTWADKLKSDGALGLVSANGYPGAGFEFADPTAADYQPQAGGWAWDDTFEWLARLK